MKRMVDIEIFVIDDDKDTTNLIGIILDRNGIHNYTLFNDPDTMLDQLNDKVHICVVDYMLGDRVNGLDLIKQVIKRNKHCWFIMLSGQSDRSVIIDYLNSTFGGRYIEKVKDDLSICLVKYIKEITEHIHFMDSFFSTVTRLEKGFEDLKNLLKGGT